MPPPAEPYISAAAGLSAQEAADADQDYLYFLRHVRLDGDAYTVVIPSEDGAASAPQVIRYEQPLPDHNAGTPSNCGEQRAPPSPEENRPQATSEAAPRGVKRKAPAASPGGGGGGGEVSSGAVPREEDTPTPVAEPAWYDQSDIDEDYRFFLRQTRVVEDKLVFKMGNRTIIIGEGFVDHSDAEEDEDTEEEVEEEEDEEDDEVDNPSSGQSEENDDEEEAIPASVTEVKEEEEEVSEEEDDVDDDNYVGPGLDLQIVDKPVYYETKKVEGMKPLNALVWGTTDLDPLGKKEASSSKGHLGMPLNASEVQGVIWPPHINDRPNSAFKEKLIEFLIKPFTQEEYDKLLALATYQSPLLKERRTRNKVAYYPWTHEMNKSYFDRYPDLAEQFSLQCNNRPNGLALLRGLSFWLQNFVGHEDQFQPWSDGFKKYRVVME